MRRFGPTVAVVAVAVLIGIVLAPKLSEGFQSLMTVGVVVIVAGFIVGPLLRTSAGPRLIVGGFFVMVLAVLAASIPLAVWVLMIALAILMLSARIRHRHRRRHARQAWL